MSAMVRSIVMGRSRLLSRACLLQGSRHSHTQRLWERILGRKIEPSTVKALEEAFLEFKVSKSVPSWLPFLPNSSFWIPCSEVTLKNLEYLAQQLQESRQPHEKRPSGPSFTASPDLADAGISSAKALSAIKVASELVEKLEGIPLEDGTKVVLVDVSGLRKGVDYDEDDEDDDEYDDEYDEGEESEDEEPGSLKGV